MSKIEFQKIRVNETNLHIKLPVGALVGLSGGPRWEVVEIEPDVRVLECRGRRWQRRVPVEWKTIKGVAKSGWTHVWLPKPSKPLKKLEWV